MMSHKNCGSGIADCGTDDQFCRLRSVLRVSNPQSAIRNPQSGYTLVALLAIMTLLALFAMAAAPSILQQAQREREKEAIFRGEEMADAIRAYFNAQVSLQRPAADPALPTSIDDLIGGVTRAGRTKKLQILRPSAARDPLMPNGEWRLVKPRSQNLIDFQQAVMLYAGNVQPPTTDRSLAQAQQRAGWVPAIIAISNLGTSALGASDDNVDNSSGPFVGVASQSKRNSVITYYGIERHDKWVFTPLFR